ncbi:unnamed protein product [Symbiodinium natans]|uniref:EF-hand domain-containing protein n=1 Tax=Symbiodinium natans TaxID=878477 RepID=A0A812L829_9DINO|nr:unnamed protein product [Symbiodinium natans]
MLNRRQDDRGKCHTWHLEILISLIQTCTNVTSPMSDGRRNYPRGSSGGVLRPGVHVIIHGIRSVRELNGQEGTCLAWLPEKGRIHVQLEKSVKALRPANLKVVQPPRDTNAMLDRVLEVFQSYDSNGNGVLELDEFERCLAGIGLGKEYITAFQLAMDKDGDFVVDYAEFSRWALGSEVPGTHKTRLELYWPQKGPKAAAEHVDDDDTVPDADVQLTEQDIERIIKKKLPEEWPAHGMKIVNNARSRFPNYPIEGIVWSMRRNDYIGGKVLADIRSTGAREVHVCQTTLLLANAQDTFPAVYRNISPEGDLFVYSSAELELGPLFAGMRDRKLSAMGMIRAGELFTVYEVRQGIEYGFCFGRIKFKGQENPATWVVLGLLIEPAGIKFTTKDRKPEELTFSDAERVNV